METFIEPFFYCLFASTVWAPLVFFIAHRLCANDNGPVGALGSLSGKIWPMALVLAALPVMMAPIAASLGLSLRAPAPLPPMAELAASPAVITELAEPTALAATTTITLADILRMAAVLYFYGFLMLLALAFVRHIWFAYRLNYATPLDEPILEEKLEGWRDRLGVRQQPRYVFSHIVSSVCVYGFLRPVVVFPYDLLERVSVEDAALMGAHEMAHVKRGDVALFAMCSIIKAVFWFNPFMHRICARATLAAEQGADALVLASGVSRRQYAHCFVQGLKLASGSPQHRFAGELVPSFTPFDKKSRRARLDAILSGNSESSLLSLPTKLSLGAGALLAAGLAFAQAAFAVTPPPAALALPVTPVEGKIGFEFGKTSELLGPERQSHEGVDIRAARGTPVKAAGEGKVIDATSRYQGSTAWGNVVVIDHGHGLVTRYAHLDSFIVHKGEIVDAGDVIGAVGSTGKATGPHLHFEILENGTPIDPAPVLALAPAVTPVPSAAPKTKHSRHVPVAPAPEVAPIPTAEPAPSPKVNHIQRVKSTEKKARRLDGRLAQLESKLRQRFENFDAFKDLEDVTIKFNDIELEGFEDFAEMIEGQEFHFNADDFEFEGFQSFGFISRDGDNIVFSSDLSAEDQKQLRRAQEQAKRQAAEAMERAKAEMAQANRNAEQARREALRYSEAERERAEERARRDEERAERDAERAERDLERALRQMERDMERAERDLKKAVRSKDKNRTREAALVVREQAIKKAKADLDRQLKEIEKERKALERKKRQR
ncbi:peptidoglycan DD-metalloendopeptidase family protein [Hyphococcus flavus]|uniref:Peptidoglycan DD-metalloendopeptidase family protein n=1 Tax=Hyphococcus flavus TaxID=1866326 RepID=A0AAE9ZFU3_9PROT|nr:peptidoglycan DD-metalloendopeptidase family protein [Hyphococcus flavus]WDI31982.1 peptidoglycan DD-metalloendopeptidase family protein [Hyphococcus flavus]